VQNALLSAAVFPSTPCFLEESTDAPLGASHKKTGLEELFAKGNGILPNFFIFRSLMAVQKLNT